MGPEGRIKRLLVNSNVLGAATQTRRPNTTAGFSYGISEASERYLAADDNSPTDVACWHEPDHQRCPQFGRYRG